MVELEYKLAEMHFTSPANAMPSRDYFSFKKDLEAERCGRRGLLAKARKWQIVSYILVLGFILANAFNIQTLATVIVGAYSLAATYSGILLERVLEIEKGELK